MCWLPWWLDGKDYTCQHRRYEFDLWSRKIPYASEQLSPCATSIEPVLRAWEPQLLSPPSLQLQKSPHSNEDPAQTKIKKKNDKFRYVTRVKYTVDVTVPYLKTIGIK